MVQTQIKVRIPTAIPIQIAAPTPITVQIMTTHQIVAGIIQVVVIQDLMEIITMVQTVRMVTTIMVIPIMVHQVTHMGLTRIIQINHLNLITIMEERIVQGMETMEAIIVIMIVALHIKETRTQTIVQTIHNRIINRSTMIVINLFGIDQVQP